MSKFWKFKNNIGDDPELLVYGQISDRTWFGDEVLPRNFKQDLDGLGNPPNINVRINSVGGDVFAAHAIFNLLKSNPANITVIVDGLAASAATIVAMAGDKVQMPSNAMMMVHNPALMLFGSYSAEDMDKMSDTLATVKDSIINAYVTKTGRSVKDLSKLMDAETWMSAQQALDEGFCDEILYGQDVTTQMSTNTQYMVVNSVAHDRGRFAGYREAMKTRVINGIIPPNISTQTAPEDTEWAAPTLEDFTAKTWGELSSKEKKDIAGHFAWEAQSPPDTFGDMKLPHHQAKDGLVVWDGVRNAAARLDQANIPSADIAKVKAHLGEHYKAFDKVSTWDEPKATTPPGETINKLQEVSMETLDELKAAYPDLIKQLVTDSASVAVIAERARLQEIDAIAKNLDAQMVVDAKYGEKPMNAKDLAYEAMKVDNARGADFVAARAAELEAANTKKVDGMTDQQSEEHATVDKIAAAANKKLHGGKK